MATAAAGLPAAAQPGLVLLRMPELLLLLPTMLPGQVEPIQSIGAALLMNIHGYKQ